MKEDFDAQAILDGLVAGLEAKARKVISARCGLGGNKKVTLSFIGNELHLSRERIRQIERDAIIKLCDRLHDNFETAIQYITGVIDSAGGVLAEEELAKLVLTKDRQNPAQYNALRLFLRLTKHLIEIKDSKTTRTGWVLKVIDAKSVYDAMQVAHDQIAPAGKVLDFSTLWEMCPAYHQYPKQFLQNSISLSREIITTTDGQYGLATWSTINPKNMRDKIYYVLNQSGAPLHFTEITKKIHENAFDSKKIVQPTVHNELIADDRFVLVGRGIYALSHWGYKPGTVEDVIAAVLKKAKGPMTTDEIVTEVLKSRQVKKNTVIINLQIKPQFVKVGRKLYTIKPATKGEVTADVQDTLKVAAKEAGSR